MKKFDCIEMKRRIQEELSKEYAGLSPEDIRVRQDRRISENHRLRKFLRQSKTDKVPQIDEALVSE